MAVPLRCALFVILIGIIHGAPAAPRPRPTCIDSCNGMADGQYHKCNDCRFYIECTGGSMKEERCPDDKYFDENEGCTYDSKTCAKTHPIGECVATCTPALHGDYQHCTDCTKFIMCHNGRTSEMYCAHKHPLPTRLFWDDDVKSCEWESTTCSGEIPTNPPTAAPTTPAPTAAPTTPAPTAAPTTPAPTAAPTTPAPTAAPTTPAPTAAPTTPAPTAAPTTPAPTAAPTTPAPTAAPITPAPTAAPTTPAPTAAPTTPAPTAVPTTPAPTAAPTTPAPTAHPDYTPKPPHLCPGFCVGKAYGAYQHCSECTLWIHCAPDGQHEKYCAKKSDTERLVWDDNVKTCAWTSTTCPGPGPSPDPTVPTPPPTRTPGDCVDDCTGLADGDYQSCDSCNHYVSCVAGGIYKMRPCAANRPGEPPLCWDDTVKECRYNSSTCDCNKGATPPQPTTTTTKSPPTPTPPRPPCVDDCTGLADGDYQSCDSCNHYVSCVAGGIYKMRPCAANRPGEPPLCWDDTVQECRYTSPTCDCNKGPTPPPPTTTTTKSPTTPTPPRPPCVDDCTGMADGDYQSCDSCNHYVSCVAGGIYKMRPCAPSDPPLCWDDTVQECRYTSPTCDCSKGPTPPPPTTTTTTAPTTPAPTAAPTTPAPTPTRPPCVDDCTGLADGDYQSCDSCNHYVSCVAGGIYKMRPCAANRPGEPPLCWDDTVKECRYNSSTCDCNKGPTPPPPTTTTTTAPTTPAPTAAPTTPAPTPPRPPCVDDCTGLADGDYQSCDSCNHYVSCVAGHIYKMRPCAPSDPPLCWDDNVQECRYTSPTCDCNKGATPPPPTTTTTAAPTTPAPTAAPTTPAPTPAPTTPAPTPTRPPCVDDCTGLADGDYQSCDSCNHYVSCVAGGIYKMRPCAANRPGEPPLCWDDTVKECRYNSSTCDCNKGATPPQPTTTTTKSPPTPTPPRPPCVDDCTGLADGDYQSCDSCNHYVSCVAGHIYKMRPCAPSDPPLCWDDTVQECRYTSPTCDCNKGATPPPPTTTTTKSPPTPTPPRPPCVDDCTGLADGDFQSCDSCNHYVSCVAGGIYKMRPCAANHPGQPPLCWDDTVKECRYNSSTCDCNKGATPAPTTPAPTAAPTTPAPTAAPTTPAPTAAPTTPAPTAAPTTPAPTAAPTTPAPTAHPDYTPKPPHLCPGFCVGKAYGAYQHCSECTLWIHCAPDGQHEKYCAKKSDTERLVWDDKAKTCAWTSTTCPGPGPSPDPTVPTPPPTRTPGDCVDDCTGLADGDYQSCDSCNHYVSCVAGGIYKMRPCAANRPGEPPLCWDDTVKECRYNSSTCDCNKGATPPQPTTTTTKSPPTPTPPRPPCVDDCTGLADGDYQSCDSCNHYVSCVAGHIYKMRPCAPSDPPLCWDDTVQECRYTSPTCDCNKGATPPPPTTTTTKSPPTPTPPRPPCVDDCTGLADGDYQSCDSCNHYVSCVAGGIYKMRPCAANRPGEPPLCWDDTVKECRYNSSTCDCNKGATPPPPTTTTTKSPPTPTPPRPPCVDDCTGLADGDYQSCDSCNHYVSCVAGGIYKMRPCAPSDPPLCWDDTVQECRYTSPTCDCNKGPTPPPPTTTTTTAPTTPAPTAAPTTPAPTAAPTTPAPTAAPTTPAPTAAPTTPAPTPTRPPCVDDCTGLADGDYQSCDSCNHYVSCVAGGIYKMRPCAANHPGQPPLCWDDTVKECRYNSSTCDCNKGATPPPPTTTTTTPLPVDCADSCKDRPDGDYQSCDNCHMYVSCCNGKMFNNRICPVGLVWDDYKKGCLWVSETCSLP